MRGGYIKKMNITHHTYHNYNTRKEQVRGPVRNLEIPSPLHVWLSFGSFSGHFSGRMSANSFKAFTKIVDTLLARDDSGTVRLAFGGSKVEIFGRRDFIAGSAILKSLHFYSIFTHTLTNTFQFPF
jgi:hypothetical protein